MTLAEPTQSTTPKPGRRVPTFKKMQRRLRQGPAVFRQEKEAEAVKKEEDAKKEAEEAKKPKRKLFHPEGTPLRDLVVGQELSAIAQNMMPYGVFMDVGAQKDGMVHVRDMSVDFVHAPRDIIKSGDQLRVWVKYIDPVKQVLGLTMIKPEMGFANRIPLAEIKEQTIYDGVVERITNYGAYVDIGAERMAFLHVSSVWGKDPRTELDYMRLGEKLCVYVQSVDTDKRHVRLIARDIDGFRLTEGAQPEIRTLIQTDVEPEAERGGVATKRPWDSEEDADGAEEEDASASKGEEGEEEEEEEEVVDEGFDFVNEDQPVSFEGIEHMLSQDTEFIDMESYIK